MTNENEEKEIDHITMVHKGYKCGYFDHFSNLEASKASLRLSFF